VVARLVDGSDRGPTNAISRRAVLFDALITAVTFASLTGFRAPPIASMALLLTIVIFWSLVCSLWVLLSILALIGSRDARKSMRGTMLATSGPNVLVRPSARRPSRCRGSMTRHCSSCARWRVRSVRMQAVDSAEADRTVQARLSKPWNRAASRVAHPQQRRASPSVKW
jgi:hypothetical protein